MAFQKFDSTAIYNSPGTEIIQDGLSVAADNVSEFLKSTVKKVKKKKKLGAPENEDEEEDNSSQGDDQASSGSFLSSVYSSYS